ncbi:MAG: FAD-binding oxidoreductase, partial [Myxococcales bacterium]
MRTRRDSSRPGWLPGSRESHDAQREHGHKVERIALQLRRHPGDRPVSLRKKAVPHQVPKPLDRRRTDDKIDVTDLTSILTIDVEARTCTAESGVTFEQLVEATLRHGLVPIIVPEFKTITVGGAVTGCSVESMSFQHGGFHDTCLAYEMITATGEVLECTRDNEHAHLFEMLHGSFGTLGVLTRLTFRLIPARPFVHVVYETYTTLADYQAAIWRRYEARDVDFMDGIIHSPTKYVLSLGTFVDQAPYTSAYDWLKVYYRSTATRRDDYLRTPDYFFRYNNGVTNVHPKSFLGRLFLGKFLHSDRLLRLAERFHKLLPADRPTVTLDTFIPFSRFATFMDWYTAHVGHFPLWCVPYRIPHRYGWIADGLMADIKDNLFVDLAIYGLEQPRGRNIYREIEEFLPRVSGIKTLIAYNYYDEDSFWQSFHRGNHQRAKQRTDPRNLFRDLFTKTCRAAQGLDDAVPATT